jgi:hypothetical protein
MSDAKSAGCHRRNETADMTSRIEASPLWRKLVEHKVALISIVTLATGIVLMLVADSSVSQSEAYSRALGTLIDQGQSPSDARNILDSLVRDSGWATILWNISGTLVSIGLIALAWDLWLNLSWINLLREELYSTLARPSSIRRVRRSRQGRLLSELLNVYHGNDVGSAMYAESQAMRRGARMLRKDFLYNIEISKLNEHFHRADLHISFVLPKVDPAFTVQFSRVRDSLDFHSRYQDLVDSAPRAIYRYVLHSAVAPPIDETSFTVTQARVESCESGRTIDLTVRSVTPMGDQSAEFQLCPTGGNKGLLRKICANECRVTLTIRTLVDAGRTEFPIWLGYPVREFRSRIVTRSIGAREVDVLEFFSSNTRYRREDFETEPAGPPSWKELGHGTAMASGVLDDLILPNSGLTYVWR